MVLALVKLEIISDASTENDDNQDAIEEAGVAEEPSSDASTENDDNQDTSEETGVAEEPPSGSYFPMRCKGV
ncbi:hypothetical protein OESDEN_02066 [Oesophagostomum dentatum]|uniref:Uncharacterized protein n=1 Tax=Oesophagostomum dentatum TaxID=61180 RepID=A0A0B1TK56_OESDE|nr:hypothetical protein OESDEN_02066 [Oesophagostomum dentatum]